MIPSQKSIILFLILFSFIILTIPLAHAGKYVPIIQEQNGETGTLTVMVLCHNNLFSREMTLTNDLSPKDGLEISLKSDGTFNDRFIEGDYTLVLHDGNAGKQEIKRFRITKGYDTLVTFIGHAVSRNSGKEPICYTEKVWIPGKFIYKEIYLCWRPHHCSWFSIPIWICGHWEDQTICEQVKK